METVYGVYPEAHEVVQDTQAQTVTIRNRFYSITHSLAHGGAIVEVRYLKGSDRNLLLNACAGEVTLAAGEGTYSERHDAETKLTIERQGTDVQLTFEGSLRDAEGKEGGIAYRHTYLHRWGHVRVDKSFTFPAETRVSRLCVHSWSVRPELCHWGYRPGAPAEGATWTAAFGVCRWGRFTPGKAFDCACESRFVPRYVCCADPGARASSGLSAPTCPSGTIRRRPTGTGAFASTPRRGRRRGLLRLRAGYPPGRRHARR